LGTSTRIFIDFWNFSLNWNDRMGKQRCDWLQLPTVLTEEARKCLSVIDPAEKLSLEETLVYASVKAGDSEVGLKTWLTNFLDKQPSFRVNIRERKERLVKIRCNGCQKEHDRCPDCDTPFKRAPEKGVDTAIVTDLLSLGSEGRFDVAILLTSDADFIPAVERIQERGLKVINATWAGHGHDLAHTCWASFVLDEVTAPLVRK
jgi:uncharacterized LabA/DUF88 family protein